MGRQVTVTLVCDVCNKPVDEAAAIPGELATNRRRFMLQMHRDCMEKLVATADQQPRKKRGPGRPKGSKNKPKAAAK